MSDSMVDMGVSWGCDSEDAIVESVTAVRRVERVPEAISTTRLQ
jgi:hypothetical protein